MKIISRSHFSFPSCSLWVTGCPTASLELSAGTIKTGLGVTNWGFLSGFPTDYLGQATPSLRASVSLCVKWGGSISGWPPPAATAGRHLIEKNRVLWEGLWSLLLLCRAGFSVCRQCQVNSWWLCCHCFQIPHLEPFLFCSAVWQKSPFRQPSHGLINSFKT